MADRNALLQQIQGGKKLKKATTNDRSAPTAGGAKVGGGGPPPGGMGLPRPPMVPPGAGGAGRAAAPEPKAAPMAMPGLGGLGGLFSGERPKLRHRTGGVNIGKSSEENDTPAPEKPAESSRFMPSFLRKSHNRSSSHGAPEPAPASAHVSPRPPAVPERRADPIAPPPPPVSAPPTRPPSSISAKRAPPLPPTSKKPTIKPKPAGLGASRLSAMSSSPNPASGSSPNPAMSSSPNMRSQLRPASAAQGPSGSPRNSADGQELYGGIISESQGSVSSLRGMFGQSVKNRVAAQSRPLAESTLSELPRAPAKAPPPLPPSIADASSNSHRRTSSFSPSQPPPPLPPVSAVPPSRPAAATNGSSAVPVHEGKWTFHTVSDLPPPPSFTIPRHVYPSRNYTGSTIILDI
ncbi:hypothetical protein IWW56_001974 [Coemansia sp. RSA 2131]|nr:hypothetical protein IWW56_001974 [Coemansia sp. RSA 2131]